MTGVPIETPYGPIPLPVAIPHENPPISIPHGPHFYWADVKNWGEGIRNGLDAVAGLFGTVATVTIENVNQMISDATTVLYDVIGSYANLAIDYTSTVSSDLHDLLDTTQSFMLDSFQYVEGVLTYLEAGLVQLEQRLIQGIEADVGYLEDLMRGAIDVATAGIIAWAIDNIYNPLLGEIAGVERGIYANVGGAIDALRDELSRLEHADYARLAGELGALAGALALVETWVTECGVPMCDEIGPRTNFKQLWDALKGFLAILAGVELSQLTLDDLDRAANTLASVGADPFAAFMASFAQGEQLGTAGAEVLGDITSTGTSVLRDLGIPV